VKLKEFLDAANIQYKDFAKKVGVAPNTILNIIHRGDCKLSIAVAIEDITMNAVTCREILAKEKEQKYRRGPYRRQALAKPDDKTVNEEKTNRGDYSCNTST
jgi:DNA-binding XRE family transcriptional regulator